MTALSVRTSGSSRRSAFAVLGAGLFAAACQLDFSDRCHADTDCAAGRVCSGCLFGCDCVVPSGGTCDSNAQCAAGKQCRLRGVWFESGVSRKTCEGPPFSCDSDADCPSGYPCVPAPFESTCSTVVACQSDVECAPHERCAPVGGGSASRLCFGLPCLCDSDCPAASTCTGTSGLGSWFQPAGCAADRTCTYDTECEEGEECRVRDFHPESCAKKTCVPRRCACDDECPPGLLCGWAGCWSPGDPVCASDAECATGRHCAYQFDVKACNRKQCLPVP